MTEKQAKGHHDCTVDDCCVVRASAAGAWRDFGVAAGDAGRALVEFGTAFEYARQVEAERLEELGQRS